jgi:predicted acyl esterase
MEMDVRRDVGIPSRDGTRLSANLFLPGGDGSEAWPAVLNMDPYRKDDWSAGWDLTLGTYLAERGYAYCRLDVRGTGSSDGVALDEYTEAETWDGYDAVEWLATQPWCSGRVGMWGLSYGGFTSLQVATLRPPHLFAIVPIQATDDRYTDDVHYVGGTMTVSELAQYAVAQVATNAMPPEPAAWGASASRRRRRGSWNGLASSATGPTGAVARSLPSTSASRRRFSSSVAGWTSTSTRRCGSRPAARAPLGAARSSGRGSTGCPITPIRVRTSTGCTSWSGGSIGG